MCVCGRGVGGGGTETDRQTERRRHSSWGNRVCSGPVVGGLMEDVGEWDLSQCGWSLERERRLEARPVAP